MRNAGLEETQAGLPLSFNIVLEVLETAMRREIKWIQINGSYMVTSIHGHIHTWSHPYMTTGKTIALTRRTFVDKVMSLLFNILSRLAITFLPRSKCLLISWLQSPSAVILEPPKIKSETVPHLFALKSPCRQSLLGQCCLKVALSLLRKLFISL